VLIGLKCYSMQMHTGQMLVLHGVGLKDVTHHWSLMIAILGLMMMLPLICLKMYFMMTLQIKLNLRQLSLAAAA
jgi:hypothetical protein